MIKSIVTDHPPSPEPLYPLHGSGSLTELILRQRIAFLERELYHSENAISEMWNAAAFRSVTSHRRGWNCETTEKDRTPSKPGGRS